MTYSRKDYIKSNPKFDRQIQYQRLDLLYEGWLRDNITKLEKQIESMKCCGNCDNEELDYGENHCRFWSICEVNMKEGFKGVYDDHWKIKESN